jgi:hypothetical protein
MYEATQEQIQEWKDKYGSIHFLKVKDKQCYLKLPSRKALGYAMVASNSNPIVANETILNDCWIAGDEEIKTDDSLFLSVCSKLNELIVIEISELGKL